MGPVNSAVQRTKAVFSMVQDVQTNAVANLQNFVFPQDVSSGAIAAIDIYNHPWSEVESMLRDRVTVTNLTTANTTADAYSLGNLTAMSWTIPEGSQVEEVVTPDNYVTCIRIVEENPG